MPELVSGLRLAREREPEGNRELLVFLGDQELPFPTLIATMKAAEAAGLTKYVLLVEKRDGTVLVKTEPK